MLIASRFKQDAVLIIVNVFYMFYKFYWPRVGNIIFEFEIKYFAVNITKYVELMYSSRSKECKRYANFGRMVVKNN